MSKRGSVTDELRRRIVLNELAPGTLLTELATAAEFGRSQGAIREALLRLEGEGLLIRSGHQGTAVTGLEPADAAEIVALRKRIEGRAARAVAERLTEEDRAALNANVEAMREAAMREDLWGMIRSDMDFHLRLFGISGLHAMAAILARCMLHTHRFRLWAPWHERPLLETAERHGEIMAELRARDAAGLKRALEQHLDTIVFRGVNSGHELGA